LLNPRPCGVAETAEALIAAGRKFSGSVALDPPPDGDVVGVQAPISEQLLDVTVRKKKTQVPRYRQQDDLRLKLAPFEPKVILLVVGWYLRFSLVLRVADKLSEKQQKK
jgi:hypothetical protein